MADKVIRTAFAGSGYAAKFHYDALKRISSVKVDVTGAWSPTRERLEKFAHERNIKAFNSPGEMIASADVVHICTPPSSHEAVVIAALEKGKSVIVEKPLTGYFGDGTDSFGGDSFPREKGLEATLGSIGRMLEAEKKSTGKIMYAENWIYAPAVQKEKEIIEKSDAQVLRMIAEESHSGSHSETYGIWKFSGGGSMIGKGCHPLSAAVYFK